MYSKTLTLLLLLFIPLSIICQSKYEKGYIIKKQGEKIKGYIKYSLNKSLCQQITFLSSDQTKKTVYYPSEIKEFKFENLNRIFKQITLPRLDSTTITDTIQNVFAEVLVETPKRTLFFYKPIDSNRRLFIQTPEIKLKELIREVKNKEVNGSNFVYVNKKYIGLLKICFKDCKDATQNKLDNLGFTIGAIANFFTKSSRCLGEKILHESAAWKDKGNLQIVFGAGISYVSTEMVTYRRSGWWKSMEDPQPLVGTPFGLSLYYYPPFIRNTFFLGISSSYSLKGAYSEISETRFEQHYLNLGLSLGYHYPFGKIKPYWGTELTRGILMNQNDAFISTHPTDFGTAILVAPKNYKRYAGEVGLGLFVGVDIPFSACGIRAELKYHYGLLPTLANFAILQQHALQLQVQFRISPLRKNRNSF
ncbi:hypothetical protein [Aureispira anguillae]|uniref:Outer membrane protein beta-barrel domain-containing protein n=1 Tax=Aureispira anguillae TaxID=2864201 RepID=A0A916DQN7_9BACT|nr:hypothetical protein [Aureispira anguillae]BDS10821.1 hypothetical protein AsAng_0015300 [Aureispira anguillae]